MSSDPDVLIVGAGPAGSVAALVLARGGVRVRVVDRDQFPRDKLCGDTLNPGTMALLDRLDPALGTAIRCRAVRIDGMLVTGPGGVGVASSYPHGLAAFALPRRDLDALLLEAAAHAGAEVIPGVHVKDAIVDGGRVTGVRGRAGARPLAINAKVTIAADGRRSCLAFGLNLARFASAPRRWAYGAYFAGVDGMSTRGEMHVRSDGYIGVAPLPGDLTNVCVVREIGKVRLPLDSHSGHPEHRRGVKPDTPHDANAATFGVSGFSRTDTAATVIRNAIAADPLLRERFARAEQVSRVTVLGPLAVDASAAGCPGLLLAGDAAGFVDPMTGDGLRFAVRGAELAAAAALRALETGVPAHDQLHAGRRREFSGKWRINRTLRALVGTPRAVELATHVSRHWNAPVRTLIGIAGDVNVAVDNAIGRTAGSPIDEFEPGKSVTP